MPYEAEDYFLGNEAVRYWYDLALLAFQSVTGQLHLWIEVARSGARCAERDLTDSREKSEHELPAGSGNGPDQRKKNTFASTKLCILFPLGVQRRMGAFTLPWLRPDWTHSGDFCPGRTCDVKDVQIGHQAITQEWLGRKRPKLLFVHRDFVDIH